MITGELAVKPAFPVTVLIQILWSTTDVDETGRSIVGGW